MDKGRELVNNIAEAGELERPADFTDPDILYKVRTQKQNLLLLIKHIMWPRMRIRIKRENLESLISSIQSVWLLFWQS